MERLAIAIRPAEPAHAAAIAELYLASFRAAYEFPLAHTDDEVRSWWRDAMLPQAEVWVALDGAAVVGVLALGETSLDQLYVAPGQWDRGIGSGLVEHAKERRPGGLDLYTFQVNERARRFYERRGFRAAWFGDGSANEEGQPDVRYEWRPGG